MLVNTIKSQDGKIEVRIMKDGDKLLFNVEDSLIGLGLVNTIKGVTYPKWKRAIELLDAYRGEEGVGELPTEFRSGDYIDQDTLFLLTSRCNGASAKSFQVWMAYEVMGQAIEATKEEITTNKLVDIKHKYFTEEGRKETLMYTSDNEIEAEYEKLKATSDDKEHFEDYALEVLKERTFTPTVSKLAFNIQDKKLEEAQRALEDAQKALREAEEQVRYLEPPIEDYTVINKHGFSVNYQYKTLEGDKKINTPMYQNWWDSFPVDELPSIEGIDFTRQVDLHLQFTHIDRQEKGKNFDCSNFQKSIIDRACAYWGVDDSVINIKNCKSYSSYRGSYSQGKIYMCLRQK